MAQAVLAMPGPSARFINRNWPFTLWQLLILLFLGGISCASVHACTLWGAAGVDAGGGTIISKNRDWKPDHVQVLKMQRPTNGYAYFGLYAEGNDAPGIKEGINEKGLTVVTASAGTIPKQTREAQPGKGSLISTLLANCANCDEVLAQQDKLFSQRRPTFVMIADRKQILMLEVGLQGRYSMRAVKTGTVVHANHYLDETMQKFNLKTNRSSCVRVKRIADLLRHGLLKGSFIPSAELRALRDLTRYRTRLGDERVSEINRVQKVLEDANIKLASVATDVMGVSGRAMLDQIVQGQADPAVLAELARGRLREKQDLLQQALSGRVQAHHRFMLAQHLSHIDFLEEAIARLDQEIAEQMRPFAAALEAWDSLPGINQRIAEIVVAEIGADLAPLEAAAAPARRPDRRPSHGRGAVPPRDPPRAGWRGRAYRRRWCRDIRWLPGQLPDDWRLRGPGGHEELPGRAACARGLILQARLVDLSPGRLPRPTD